jgi:hypothetical protein
MEAMPLSSKEKQQDYRARMRLLGMQEVRGIFLPPAMHAALKAYARKLAESVSANASIQSGVEAELMRKKSGSKPRQS